MPIDDPELPLWFEYRRDGARQAELIGDAVEGVCKKNVIDRLRHDRIDSHRVRHDKLAVVGTRRSNLFPRLIQHDRVDVDGVDTICDAASGAVNRPSPQQRSTATMPGSHAHFARTFAGSGHNACHQSASGIVVVGKKPTIMRFHARRTILDRRFHSIILVNDRRLE